ncbi:MAG: outer membrane lipoprotein carrier protein LolA [Pseudomonadota bacterium]
MHRRALIAFTLAPAAALAQVPPRRPAQPAPPPAPQRGSVVLAGAERAAVLARVEAYLGGIRTLKARFLQLAQNGATAEGTAWIQRPGRMRFDYDPPTPMLLVASFGQFLFYDRELRSPSVVPTSATPLGILLQENLRLSGTVTIEEVARESGFLAVTLFRTDSPGDGRLTLIMEEEPMQLRQWVVLDSQNRTTRVTLSRIETGLTFDTAIFAFNDPRFFEPGGLGAPQR